ncbi:MAG: M15 family metallopeptidase [Treponema sp.]|jgi:D-alanyl-D-alanine carboxypeptidase|nr:M15 family metallopeptidase [Treponema sp.]
MLKKMALLVCLLPLFSCIKANSSHKTDAGDAPQKTGVETQKAPVTEANEILLKAERVLQKAGIPADIAKTIVEAARSGHPFIDDLNAALKGDPYLRFLVDKQHPLPHGYEPDDLVPLVQGKSYRIGRNDLRLRGFAEASLEEMAKAAKADGVTLLASSSYRSYDYQTTVYNRNVREMGKEAADRESAPPGCSQHQTGLALDFGSIDDTFAETKAGKWLPAHASGFGWSLSFPNGYESVTGYRWESWHYRYVGVPLAHFIDSYFNGIQQYALQFLHEWEQDRATPVDA